MLLSHTAAQRFCPAPLLPHNSLGTTVRPYVSVPVRKSLIFHFWEVSWVAWLEHSWLGAHFLLQSAGPCWCGSGAGQTKVKPRTVDKQVLCFQASVSHTLKMLVLVFRLLSFNRLDDITFPKGSFKYKAVDLDFIPFFISLTFSSW